MKTTLNKIPVHFFPQNHVYIDARTGNTYNGITSTLLRRLFPNKYDGVPEHVMEEARERGTKIHEELELIEGIGIEPTTTEGKNYLRLKAEHNLRYLASEYTVSDLHDYATNIDVIYEVKENVVDLADYKTTFKLDKESVSWQLSICSYFLRQNNPHITVRNLCAIWLRDDIAELIELPVQPDEEIVKLIEADLYDLPYEYQPVYPEYISNNYHTLYTLNKKIKEMQAEYDAIVAEIKEKMQESGEKSFDTGSVLITLVTPKPSMKFDAKAFQAEHAKLYEKYTKESQSNPSLKVTIR